MIKTIKLLWQYSSYEACFVAKCVKIIDETQVTIQPHVCFNLVVHRPSFRKTISFTSNVSVETDDNSQRMQKTREICCFLRDNFLVLPIFKNKYISLIHLMRAITRAHASTRANSLMRVKRTRTSFKALVWDTE